MSDQCRGVCLDRGELDKIIERSTAAPVAAPRAEREQEIHHSREERHHDDHYFDKHGKRAWEAGKGLAGNSPGCQSINSTPVYCKSTLK